MTIYAIDKFGVVVIKFSTPMFISLNKRRELQILDENTFNLSIESENEDYAEGQKLDFTWSMLEFSETGMSLKIEWNHPTYISQSLQRDTLRIEIVDLSVIRDKATNAGFQSGTVIEATIPQ